MSKKLAVIYANESNIWDNNTHKFCFVKTTVDEMSYAMPLEEAEKVLASINEDRKKEVEETGEHIDEAYLNEIPNFEEEENA